MHVRLGLWLMFRQSVEAPAAVRRGQFLPVVSFSYSLKWPGFVTQSVYVCLTSVWRYFSTCIPVSTTDFLDCILKFFRTHTAFALGSLGAGSDFSAPPSVERACLIFVGVSNDWQGCFQLLVSKTAAYERANAVMCRTNWREDQGKTWCKGRHAGDRR